MPLSCVWAALRSTGRVLLPVDVARGVAGGVCCIAGLVAGRPPGLRRIRWWDGAQWTQQVVRRSRPQAA
ncbi:DUF2510 domain-containing protein [Curtobacterium sp. L1-20]|uniref:DUF2510 domain-containing protein n=1 Tax=Curtobacterium sp. L1-20 TaxID=3138181 RepID=UPI003B51C332